MYTLSVLVRNSDISARDFYDVQNDLEYRKKWDELVLELEIVDDNTKTNEQVLRWVTAYPVGSLSLSLFLILHTRA